VVSGTLTRSRRGDLIETAQLYAGRVAAGPAIFIAFR
jgi:hypothetical protein